MQKVCDTKVPNHMCSVKIAKLFFITKEPSPCYSYNESSPSILAFQIIITLNN